MNADRRRNGTSVESRRVRRTEDHAGRMLCVLMVLAGIVVSGCSSSRNQVGTQAVPGPGPQVAVHNGRSEPITVITDVATMNVAPHRGAAVPFPPAARGPWRLRVTDVRGSTLFDEEIPFGPPAVLFVGARRAELVDNPEELADE